MSTTSGESTSRKSSDFEYEGCRLLGCGPWRWYRGVGRVHMNRGRVGEERGGKEMDGCPLTHPMTLLIAFPLQYILFYTAYFRLLTVTLLIRCLVVISRAIASVLPVV
jgi:hypothetical protein